MHLTKIMIGDSSSAGEGCCSTLCSFLMDAAPVALCCSRSKRRKALIASIDENSTSGKFLLKRIKTAEMIEKTAVRVWLMLMAYMTSGILFTYGQTVEHLIPHGTLNILHFAIFGIFFPLHVVLLQMLRYVKSSLREKLGIDDSGKYVSTNSSTKSNSLNSSVCTTEDPENGVTEKKCTSPPPSMESRKLSAGVVQVVPAS